MTDPSGGRVASATVTVTDEARNTATRITTNEDGQYTATNLEPGTYRISVEAQGFKTTSVQGVVLNVNQTERVDIHLLDLAHLEALNPVIALELIADGTWSGAGVRGPESFDAAPFLARMREAGWDYGIVERSTADVV